MNNNAIRTSIETFHHSVSGNRVDVVGMMHYADPQYYGNVQNFVDNRTMDGAHVQYEMLKTPTDQELRAASPDTLRRLLSFASVSERVGTLFKGVGLASQVEEIQYRPSWQNHDMAALDVVKAIDPRALRDLQKSEAVFDLFDMLSPADRRQALLATLHESMSDGAAAGFTSPFMKGVILDQRNGVALSAMDRQKRRRPDTDFVLLWGEGHVPGLRKGMWQRGYKMTDRNLVTAARF